MRTTDAFLGLDCVDCGERFDPAAAPGRCPDDTVVVLNTGAGTEDADVLQAHACRRSGAGG